MKIKFLAFLSLTGFAASIALSSLSSGPTATMGPVNNGPLSFGSNCGNSGCHNQPNNGFSFPFTETNLYLSIQNNYTPYPQTGWEGIQSYTPGQTYQLAFTASALNGFNTMGNTIYPDFGVQISSFQDGTTNQAGSFGIVDTNLQVTINQGYPGIQFLEHKRVLPSFTLANHDVYQGHATWTAPTTGTGPITIYGAALANDNNGSTTGDTVFFNSITLQEDTTTSISQIPVALAGVSMYPNPTFGEASISLTETGNYMVHVFDSKGAVVTATSIQNNNFTTLDLSAQPVGVYRVHITDGTRESTQTLIKVMY